MTKTQGKFRPGFDRWFLIVSAVLAAAVIAAAVFSIVFLSNNLFKAFVPRQSGETDLNFNLEGYRQVLEDLNRAPDS